MKKLRIGFIQATQKFDVQWFKPLAFGYLKAYLDKNMENPPSMELLNGSIDTDKYDIFGISSTSQDYAEAIKIASDIKRRKKEILTILGGHHVTYLPNTLTKDFDLGVLGEGEITFFDLIKQFQENGLDPNHENLKNIKGLAIRKGNVVVLTRKRDLIEPIDILPHPYRQVEDTQYLFTSRGCPYKCSFCSSSAFWDKTRTFSAEYVVDEIEQILEAFPDTKHIPVEDDIFIINLPRLKKIICLMDQRGLNDRVAFSFAVRANMVDDQLCDIINRLNIQAVCFGAESASDRLLTVLKKKSTVAQNQKALDILHKHGINTVCSFIVGIPTETENEVIAMYEFILKNISEKKLSPSSAVNILMPMPGTLMWNYAIANGIVNPIDFEWSRLAVFASYRNSNIDNFSKWVEHRKKNNSVYLNEFTLPQDRLYEIMYKYEESIKSFENMMKTSKKLRKKIGQKIRKFLNQRNDQESQSK